MCEWRAGRDDGAGQRLGPRTAAVFGEANPQREAHLEFLFQAFDIWAERSISDFFASQFATTGDVEGGPPQVRLFFRNESNAPEPPSLFEACCRSYGETRGRARVFSLGQGLVLYAVVLHLAEKTDDFPRRVRVLRNLIEASSDELRLDRMPKILDDVHSIIRDGALETVATLNQAQVGDERLKAVFLQENPQLQSVVFALEDHQYLRGSLGTFELDAAAFEGRAAAFQSVMLQPHLWTDLLGVLLAVGEYQRQPGNARQFLFGTDSKQHDNAWRELLTGATRERLKPTRQVLAHLLDLVTAAPDPISATFEATVSTYLDQCDRATRFDWRYYMVKYPSMREEGSSTYYAEPTDGVKKAAMGYSLCMLKAGKKMLSSYYRDPYLLAIWRELGDSGDVEDKQFTGYENQPRRLSLTRSGAAIRCVPSGFELSPPDPPAEAFETVCADLGANDGIVVVPQVAVDGRWIDTVDRVQMGARIVRRLIAVGL